MHSLRGGSTSDDRLDHEAVEPPRLSAAAVARRQLGLRLVRRRDLMMDESGGWLVIHNFILPKKRIQKQNLTKLN